MPVHRQVGVATVLLACFLDSLAVSHLLLHRSALFIGLHLLACVLAVRGARWIRHRHSQCWEVLGLLVTLPVPILGCTALLVWSWQSPEERPEPLEELREFVRPLEAQELKPRATYLQEIRQATETEKHLDFKANEVSVVRQLVEIDQGYWGPQKVEQLKKFKLNPRSDAFHLAQAELGKLQELFVVQISDLREQLSRSNNEGRQGFRSGHLDLHHRLAELYHEYANSGLLESDLSQYYLRCSLDLYRDLCNLDPKNSRWYRRRIDILLQHDLIDEALIEHRQAQQRFPQDSDLILAGVEALYNQGQQSPSALRDFIVALQDLQFGPDPVDFSSCEHRESADFWFNLENLRA